VNRSMEESDVKAYRGFIPEAAAVRPLCFRESCLLGEGMGFERWSHLFLKS
jgi:hypothetical protein